MDKKEENKLKEKEQPPAVESDLPPVPVKRDIPEH